MLPPEGWKKGLPALKARASSPPGTGWQPGQALWKSPAHLVNGKGNQRHEKVSALRPLRAGSGASSPKGGGAVSASFMGPAPSFRPPLQAGKEATGPAEHWVCRWDPRMGATWTLLQYKALAQGPLPGLGVFEVHVGAGQKRYFSREPSRTGACVVPSKSCLSSRKLTCLALHVCLVFQLTKLRGNYKVTE